MAGKKNKNKTAAWKFPFLTTILFLFVASMPACDSAQTKPKTESVEKYQAQFDEIYKLIYEDPALARERSQEILDGLSMEDKKSRIKSLKYIGSS